MARHYTKMGIIYNKKALKSLVSGLQKDFTPQEIKKYSEELNEFYLPTRYPDIPDPIGNYTEKIAKYALEKAEKIVVFIEVILKN